MSFIIDLFSVFLFIVIYFGFFPALYLGSFFKRTRFALIFLGVSSVLGILLVVNIKGWEIFFPLFILSFTLPGAIILWGINKNIPAQKIFLYCHIPVFAGVIIFSIFSSSTETIMQLMQEGMTSMEEVQSLKEKPEFNKNWESFSLIVSNLFFGLWYLDFFIRMMAGVAVLYRVQSASWLKLGLPPLYSIKYPDWPVWVVVSCLTGIIAGLNSSENLNFVFWISLSLLLCISSLYFLRGCSVISARIFLKNTKAPLPFYLKIILILLLFWLWPYLLIIVTTIGFFDTWMIFRKKINLS